MVKIKSYKIRREGLRGAVIGLPKVWIDDLQLRFGDKIDFYRNEENQLILVANRLASLTGYKKARRIE